MKPCCWIERFGAGGATDYRFCWAPATEVWKRKIITIPRDPAHAKLLAFAPEIFYCAKHGLDGKERCAQHERVGTYSDRKKILAHFDVCVITRLMSDTVKVPQSIDLINTIKLEVQSILSQLKALDVSAEGDKNTTGNITGPTSILLSKTSVLNGLIEVTRGIMGFENIDRRIVAMARVGTDLRNAFNELTDKKDPKAKEYIESIIKAWDESVIQ